MESVDRRRLGESADRVSEMFEGHAPKGDDRGTWNVALSRIAAD